VSNVINRQGHFNQILPRHLNQFFISSQITLHHGFKPLFLITKISMLHSRFFQHLFEKFWWILLCIEAFLQHLNYLEPWFKRSYFPDILDPESKFALVQKWMHDPQTYINPNRHVDKQGTIKSWKSLIGFDYSGHIMFEWHFDIFLRNYRL